LHKTPPQFFLRFCLFIKPHFIFQRGNGTVITNRLIPLIIAMCPAVSNGLTYHCDDDCHEESKFHYPCPTFKNAKRRCEGKNPLKFSVCTADKAVSCKARDGIVKFFLPRVRPVLQTKFNQESYQNAEYSGETAQYMAYCTAASASLCVAVGAQSGGPYGAVIGGAGGTFVSYQICKQSTRW
jgi:hypothetical protein